MQNDTDPSDTHPLAYIITAVREKLVREGHAVDAAQDAAIAMVTEKLTAAVVPDYERAFQASTTDLVMGHIDRMGDVCPEDTADMIISSFTEKFDPILQAYFNAKFPEREAQYAAMLVRRSASLASDTPAPGMGRRLDGRPRRRRSNS
jgi:hypothetical protein